jgi:predicted acyltransferase
MSQTGDGTYQESLVVYHNIENEQTEDERIPILETVGTDTNHEKEEANTEKTRRETQRMQSLDILRGMTVMLMIVVNNQPAATFWPLLHAEWHGFTPTDCVFPFFLWISGYAIGITFRNVHSVRDKWWNSTPEQREEEKRIKFCWLFSMRQSVYDEIWLWLKIFKRACLLFAIGVSFSLVGHITNPSRTRVMGVLQRISLYVFIHLLHTHTHTHRDIYIYISLLLMLTIFYADAILLCQVLCV